MAPMTLPPGFRFHPTDEELVAYYLKRKINGRKIELEIIPEVDLYRFEPWELPDKSFLPSKDLEWYFFSPRDRKYPNGSRTNRATRAGYWKATGRDRKVNSYRRGVGMKKTLVYYRGRAPHGSRTNWVMHEYRLHEMECEAPSGLQDAYALCRVLMKSAIGSEIIENYGLAPFEEQLQLKTYGQSSMVGLPPEERTEDDLENSHYHFQPHNNFSQSVVQSPSFDASASWMEHFLTEHSVISTTDDALFPCSSFYSIQSKVDERFQNGFSMTPSEVEDFSQLEASSNSKILQSGFSQFSSNANDISQEISSVASASQELIKNPNFDEDTWALRTSSDFNDFLSQVEPTHGFGSPGIIIAKPSGMGKQSTFVDISELEKGFRQEQMKQVENLRSVKVLEGNIVIKINTESQLDQHQKRIPSRPSAQTYIDVLGETRQRYMTIMIYKGVNESLIYLQWQAEHDFKQDEKQVYHDNVRSHDHSSFFEDVLEKVEFSHGLIVSSKVVAKAFFYHIAPSKKINVHINES